MKGTDDKYTKRNEAAAIVAALFRVTPRYVRLIIADIKKEKYKGANPDNIRDAYYKYLLGKEDLIRSIMPKVKKVA